MRFRKIGLALAFSPRMEALLCEAARLKKLWNAEIALIHVGDHGKKEENLLHELLERTGLDHEPDVKICWESGKPAGQIMHACRKEKVDLLIAGALRKENLVQYYLGTVARKILRKADCSVLMFTDPSVHPQPMKHIVVNVEDSPYVDEAIAAACEIGRRDRATGLHIIKEIKRRRLAITTAHAAHAFEEESGNALAKEEVALVKQALQRIPHDGLKVDIKLVPVKSGFELSKFAQRKHADLLVVGASPRRMSLLGRVFPHNLEHIFADLPCNLLMVHPRQDAK